MIRALDKKFRGLITISGPTKSGKSELAEFLIKDHDSITYIATSEPRPNDQTWQRRIDIHKRRRPDSWKLIENPFDICKSIQSCRENEAILIDSLGGLVEQQLLKTDDQWERLQTKFTDCLIKNEFTIIVVCEEVGWGIVPSTPIGHLYRERLSNLSSLISTISIKKWLVVQRTAIDLDKLGFLIP